MLIIRSGLRFLLGGLKDKRETVIKHKLDSIRQTGEALASIPAGERFNVNIDTIIFIVTKQRDGRFTVELDPPVY